MVCLFAPPFRPTALQIKPVHSRCVTTIGTATATFAPHPHTKSGATNLPDGVVHVFRDTGSAQTENFPRTDTDPEGSAGASSSDASRIVLDNADTDGVMLAVLAVPAWMTPSDFLAFVAPAAEGLAHLRMIRCVRFVSFYHLCSASTHYWAMSLGRKIGNGLTQRCVRTGIPHPTGPSS